MAQDIQGTFKKPVGLELKGAKGNNKGKFH